MTIAWIYEEGQGRYRPLFHLSNGAGSARVVFR
jgi:hypothetical protein